ncbi:hypothetical protein KR222_008453, partial [Zaprionus bogoriensis]
LNSKKMDPGGVEVTGRTEGSSSKSVDQSVTKLFKSDFDAKYNIVDVQTPLNAFMSGQYKRSYAYFRLRNHLPVVLTKVIDSLTKDKSELVLQFGENAREELKIIIGLISRLKYEMQTDKPFQKFNGDEPDREVWNNFIAGLPTDASSFYKACWLHTECYVYRKLYSFVENSIFLKQFDYFDKIKEHALSSCQQEMLALAKYTRRTDNSIDMFSELLIINLWSNRNDHSDDEGVCQLNLKVLEDVCVTNDYILANNVAEVWKCLYNKQTNRQTVDIILDNGGYELFTDFILAEYIIEKGLAAKVCFHAKAHPWFVSNITVNDFHATLRYLCRHPDYIISLIGHKFQQLLEEGKFELAPTSHFWSAPQAFSSMSTLDPELYKALGKSKLVIFKGDLNYRKLLSDVSWKPSQAINMCLGGFLPSNLCLVRLVKSEVICGLDEGVSEELAKKDPQWMISGNYGVIQFVDGSREFGY